MTTITGFDEFRLNYGPSDFDRTHNFTAAIVYELPFGKDKRYGTNWNGVTEALGRRVAVRTPRPDPRAGRRST